MRKKIALVLIMTLAICFSGIQLTATPMALSCNASQEALCKPASNYVGCINLPGQSAVHCMYDCDCIQTFNCDQLISYSGQVIGL